VVRLADVLRTSPASNHARVAGVLTRAASSVAVDPARSPARTAPARATERSTRPPSMRRPVAGSAAALGLTGFEQHRPADACASTEVPAPRRGWRQRAVRRRCLLLVQRGLVHCLDPREAAGEPRCAISSMRSAGAGRLWVPLGTNGQSFRSAGDAELAVQRSTSVKGICAAPWFVHLDGRRPSHCVIAGVRLASRK